MSAANEGTARDNSDQPLLTITGAAGRIGTSYREHLRTRSAPWRLRLQDVQPIRDQTGAEIELGDLADRNVARRAVAGAHTVLHLAADPSPEADFYATLLDSNIKATYNIFASAADAGVSRIIFASSVNAIVGYPKGVQPHTHMIARPGNVYGATKAWGEALAASFSVQHSISCIAVRIGAFTPPERLQERFEPNQEGEEVMTSMIVTAADLSRLLDCCLSAPANVDFAVVHGLSANRHLGVEIDSTRRLLGYEPKDDAFELGEAIMGKNL